MCEGRRVDERSNWSLTHLVEHDILIESSSLVISLLGPSNRGRLMEEGY
jgi:hypothetical protein